VYQEHEKALITINFPFEETDSQFENVDLKRLKNRLSRFLDGYASKSPILSNLVPYQAKIHIEKPPSYNEDSSQVSINPFKTVCDDEFVSRLDLIADQACTGDNLIERQVFKETLEFEINENTICRLKLVRLN